MCLDCYIRKLFWLPISFPFVHSQRCPRRKLSTTKKLLSVLKREGNAQSMDICEWERTGAWLRGFMLCCTDVSKWECRVWDEYDITNGMITRINVRYVSVSRNLAYQMLIPALTELWTSAENRECAHYDNYIRDHLADVNQVSKYCSTYPDHCTTGNIT